MLQTSSFHSIGQKNVETKVEPSEKLSGPTMFIYFPKLSRSKANPAGDQSHSEMIGEINGPYFFRWPHLFLDRGLAPFFS